MPTKLTKRVVDALTPKAERFSLFDAELPGLVLRVSPDGSKSFSVMYRSGSGRKAPRRRLTLGRYGSITVDQARQFARAELAKVAAGADPASDRTNRRRAGTVETLGADYLEYVSERRKDATAREYARLWKKHVLPSLGSKRIIDVTTPDVAKLHRSFKTKPYLGNRVLALVGAFFSYAERSDVGVRPKHSNPARGIEKFRERPRERFLTAGEIARLGEVLAKAEREGLRPAPQKASKRARGATAKHRPASADVPIPANHFAVAALRFLLLTGWREQEVLTLRWSDIDLKRGVATLGDTKTGKSSRVVGNPAQLLLSNLPRVAASPHVFPGREDGKPLRDISRLWYAVRYAADLKKVRLHDLRHTYASVSASAGGSLLMIGKLLGHKQSATTARYAHLLDDPVKAAADSTASTIAAWLTPSATRLQETA